ncbi:MAG: DUF1697 domain-containing protein [Burkholderiaceae bacterium]
MNTLIALLRAVNVGGTGKLPMDALRRLCEQAGFTNVRTYIQSGNVVFDTDLPAGGAKPALETRLQDYCGKPVGVILRDGEQMRGILARNPFPNAAPDKVAVLFVEQAPAPDVAATAKGLADEEVVAGELEIFIHYPSGMGRSKLRLPAQSGGTARNLNTVARLAAMADPMADPAPARTGPSVRRAGRRS